jgi:hypothetical protein
MELKFKVPVSRAQELVKDIRLLAKTGKDTFSRYLYTPIDRAGWRSDAQGQNARKMMERLENESADESYIHTIGPRCKRLISAAMSESLSALGDSSIFFLEKMQTHIKISASPEAIEFVEIIADPMSEFRGFCSQKNEVLFREKIGQLGADELKQAMDPVRLEANAEKVRIDAEIRHLYDNILIASKYNNLPKCRKVLSTYIVRYCDDPAYATQDVEKLMNALNKREEGFSAEMNATIAIELYYQITRAVLGGDIASAIQGIRKYGYIFGGDTATKYFYDIDRLERILYQMITDKGLWNQLKQR